MKDIKKEVKIKKQEKYCAMLDAEKKVKLNRLVLCALHWDYLL